MPASARQPKRLPRPLFRIDTGWLFLTAGCAIIAATVLIPAKLDLDQALWQRDRAIAIEGHRLERLARYGAYLDALRREDQSLVLSLAALKLNMSPVDRVPLGPFIDPATTSASVFPGLEPPPLEIAAAPIPPARNPRASTLERWTTDETVRLWLIGAGVLCALVGLLPAAVTQRPTPRQPANT
jgi:hypothetical protein